MGVDQLVSGGDVDNPIFESVSTDSVTDRSSGNTYDVDGLAGGSGVASLGGGYSNLSGSTTSTATGNRVNSNILSTGGFFNEDSDVEFAFAANLKVSAGETFHYYPRLDLITSEGERVALELEDANIIDQNNFDLYQSGWVSPNVTGAVTGWTLRHIYAWVSGGTGEWDRLYLGVREQQ